MKKNKGGRIFIQILISIGTMLLLAQMLIACASNKGAASNSRKKQRGAPLLIVQPNQESVYNGKPLPFSYYYEGSDTPEVYYFPSYIARETERGGTREAPVQAGTYYVLLRCRYEEAVSEYKINRSPVKITAEDNQEAYYDGNPKRVRAQTTPTVPLYYSYYPNEELRDAAIQAEAAAKRQGGAGLTVSDSWSGYRRIDRAPSEAGTYYVWIYFPGDRNHEAAQLNIEFIIYPPRQRFN